MSPFDLLNEAWIPCVLADGRETESGLRGVLRHATNIREIADPSPLVTVSLYRLLLAVLGRALPLSRELWQEYWGASALPLPAIDHYLERWRERFDLFSPEHPFYQVRGLPPRLAVPVQRLAAECASGRQPAFFDHHLDGEARPVSPAVAARWLVAHQAFCGSGCLGEGGALRGVRSGPLAHAAVVLPTGDNLRETLLLNLLPPAALRPWWGQPAADEAPAWEREAAAPQVRQPAGLLEYLTWQSRRVELLSDDRGRVARVVVAPGDDLEAQWPTLDPMVAYHVGTGLPPRLAAVRAAAGGSFWRALPVLLRSQSHRRRPLVVDWLAEQITCGVIDQRYACGLNLFALSGAEPGRAGGGRRPERWQHRQRRLPAAFLADEDLAADLQWALERAEEYCQALQAAQWVMVRGQGDPAAIRKMAAGQGAGGDYWRVLETQADILLFRLPGKGPQRDETLDWWDSVCRRQAWEALERALGRLSRQKRGLRWEMAAREHLARRAPQRLPPSASTEDNRLHAAV